MPKKKNNNKIIGQVKPLTMKRNQHRVGFFASQLSLLAQIAFGEKCPQLTAGVHPADDIRLN